MRRRELLGALGGAAVNWPLTVRAQQSAMPVIGFLHQGSLDQNVARLAAFRKGLSEAGYIDGQNVVIEFGWANFRDEQLTELAAGLVQHHVAVIATPGSSQAAIAAKGATTTIPIIFATGADPIELGLVSSLNRPGGNVTGITALNSELAAKRLGLLRQLVPKASHFYTLVNPRSALTEPFLNNLQSGARSAGVEVEILRASTDDEIDTVLASIPRRPGTVVLVGTDSFFYVRRSRIVALAARYALPAIYDTRDFAEAGGLVSYGTDFLDVVRQAGLYTGRILRGERPADLPVLQTARFELVVNLKTAKTLSLDVPPTMLLLADDVIE
jgi:putative tryptophan/tyrosine transport system substrate-binding protein